ncbi:agmatine deiminase family protein [Priestia taiwanensis]|uniref:Agmatine deiminase n=1 Tax=Priestia taiwanensis TaxID=1347902 RepID=A0A917ANE7_9BACI|nr:agmatine deiminase family protein [Priestia taiwanensis]MBM7362384.1 agmatine deiminase [Priestia taiwanensis]GGE61755.1 agmatine deiminase [Priestia taiwanensis]
MGSTENIKFHMPAEWEEHEGTWLQWPHDKTHRGEGYKAKLNDIWVSMAKELHYGENVHIVVCDNEEKEYVQLRLKEEKVDLTKIDFLIHEADDVWIRDNGPIFVKDKEGNLTLTHWIFNGWGDKYPHANDIIVPNKISENYKISKVDVDICLEGGGIEVNGQGTLMAAKSSIINENRNPTLSQEEIERALTKYLGVTNFIWITGLRGEDNYDEDTDFHIDGAARFTNENTILYEYDPFGESEAYLLEAHEKHYQELQQARNTDGKPFQLIPVPLTRKDVKEAGCKGSYLNFYIGNEVVLVPVYDDEHDKLALQIIEGQFPGRRIVGINVSKLYAYGGMIHCVTQQHIK